MKQLRDNFLESAGTVLPIVALVLLMSVTAAPLQAGVMVLFLFGTLMLIFGMSLFTIGSGMSMSPLGEGIGVELTRARGLLLPGLVCFALGVLITVAEPDLSVLAQQVPSIPNAVLILSVALGVGAFLVLAMLRTAKGAPLRRLLFIFYAAVALLAAFAPGSFIPAAFDSGGVTTGPITVPFIMALGAGMASVRGDSRSGEDSFGLVALCSVGPIISVLALSIFFKPTAETEPFAIARVLTTADAFRALVAALPGYAREVLAAFLPLVGVFLLFQLLCRRFRPHQLLRISVGLVYTFLGLVLFLTGANVGFMAAGQLIGSGLAASRRWLLVPFGAAAGFFVVAAEPAVYTLKKQVAEVTNGAVGERAIGLGLSVGVGAAVGIAMLRVVCSLPLWWFLLAFYSVALAVSFFVPPIYTGIAFDSGGVASGPMTTTFMLPLAMGACSALGGDLMTDAFGLVALVAAAPPVTIQLMGLGGELRRRSRLRRATGELSQVEDIIIYYDEEAS